MRAQQSVPCLNERGEPVVLLRLVHSLQGPVCLPFVFVFCYLPLPSLRKKCRFGVRLPSPVSIDLEVHPTPRDHALQVLLHGDRVLHELAGF